jgi:hypothetical protein
MTCPQSRSSTIDGDGADDPLADPQRPAHRRMRAPVTRLVDPQRQLRVRNVAVDQQRRARCHDVAIDAHAARQPAADHPGRQVDTGDQFQTVVGSFDEKGNGSALRAKAHDDMAQDILVDGGGIGTRDG